MRYSLRQTSAFKRDYKRAKKRGYDMGLLAEAIRILQSGEPMPEHYHDHPLSGNYVDHRECHIAPDWLLVYYKTETVLVLTLSRTGTHSDIF